MEADEKSFSNSWTTLVLVVSSTILTWTCVAVAGNLFREGLHAKNAIVAIIVVAVSIFVAQRTRTAIRSDFERWRGPPDS